MKQLQNFIGCNQSRPENEQGTRILAYCSGIQSRDNT